MVYNIYKELCLELYGHKLTNTDCNKITEHVNKKNSENSENSGSRSWV